MYLHAETGQFHFIPWDLDRAFANFMILGSPSQQMDLSLTRPYPGTHRLTERLLAIPAVRDRYQAILVELAQECFAKARLLAEIEAIATATKELLVQEADAARNRGEGRGGAGGPPAMFGAPPDLKVFVEKRAESVAAQLAGTSPGHVPTGGFGMPAVPAVFVRGGPADRRASAICSLGP
jgi:hypothetical protein